VRVVVTGGAGFIGSGFVHLLARDTDWEVVVFDAFTYAGSMRNLEDLPRPVRILRGDVRRPRQVGLAMGGADLVVHLAAETHVDRSIADASAFVRTNVLGTQVMLDAARAAGVSRFLLVSTDEVYGSLDRDGVFEEGCCLRPNNPYAASKAAADHLALAYHHTHGLPVVVTRCTNNFGPRQFPEKLVPRVILRALRRRPVPVFGDGRHVRDWIHVEDHCRALLQVLLHGRPGEVYNVGGAQERSNLELVGALLDAVGAPRSLIVFVPDRPGHDFRYALDSTKLRRELHWTPRWTLDGGLAATVAWYAERMDRYVHEQGEAGGAYR